MQKRQAGRDEQDVLPRARHVSGVLKSDLIEAVKGCSGALEAGATPDFGSNVYGVLVRRVERVEAPPPQQRAKFSNKCAAAAPQKVQR